MDSSRTPRRQPSVPFQFVGVNGDVNLPQTGINVNVQDLRQFIPQNAEALNQQTNQQIQSNYDARSRTIDAVANAASEFSQARMANSRLGQIVGALGAGLKLYGEYRKLQQDRREAAAEATFFREEARLERYVTELRTEVMNTAGRENAIRAQRQALEEIERQWRGVLPDNLVNDLQAVVNDGLRAFNTENAQKIGELQEQVREELVTSVQKQALQTATVGLRQKLANPLTSFEQAQQYFDEHLNIYLNEFRNVNATPLEMQVQLGEFYETVYPEFARFAERDSAFANQLNGYDYLIQQLGRISNITDVQEQQVAAEFLQLELTERFGLPANIVDRVLYTNRERLSDDLAQLEREERIGARTDQNIYNALPAESETVAAIRAFNILASPTINYDFERARARFENDNSPFARSSLAFINSFEETLSRLPEIGVEMTEARAQAAAARAMFQSRADKFDPDRLGIDTRVIVDMMRAIRVPVEAINELEQRGTISRETLDAYRTALGEQLQVYNTQYQSLQAEQNRLRNQFTGLGIIFNDQNRIQLAPNAAELYEQSLNRIVEEQASGRSAPSLVSPNEGVGVTAPPSTPLYRSEGLTWPSAAPVVVTSERGMRNRPRSGERKMHWGIDYVIQGDNKRVRSPQGGQVVRTFTGCRVGDTSCGGGFGNYVIIRTPTGHYEQYGHLAEVTVTQGQVVGAGDSFAIEGSTGWSTGSHVDFMVYKPGTPESALVAGSNSYAQHTMEPREYLASVHNLVAQPRDAGLPPNQPDAIDPNADPLLLSYSDYFRYVRSQNFQGGGDDGRIRTGSSYSRPSAVYNNANPRQNANSSAYRSAYPRQNRPDANYGYAVLRDDQPFREAVADVANRLNIPAQWLADVMNFESAGFQASVVNPRSGAIGLIQFLPGGGLADLANWMGTSQQGAVQNLRRMSRAEQMEYVYRWLNTYRQGNEFETIYDLYGLINQGPVYWQLSPQERLRRRDGNNSLEQLIEKIGARAGRRYRLQSDRSSARHFEIHESVVDGCPECNRQYSQFAQILPHYNPLA